MSKISYDARAVEGLKDILDQVSTIFKELEIDFFIVGAIARNIWYASHGETVIGTKDIDFGIYVPTEKKYDQLQKKLLDDYDYQVSEENAFCLITPNGKQVDLLPFGKIENGGRVMIKGKGLTSNNLDGFKKSFEMGLTKVIIGGDSYMACSIPAIMILKLIAFDDRPEHRMKDVKDINAICNHYPDIEADFIWNNHFDLYGNDKEHHEVSMIALGKEIKKIIGGNPALQNRIINILNKAISQNSIFLRHMIEDHESETLEMKANILKNIKLGITE